MATMYRTQTGEAVNVPDAKVVEAYRSGEFCFDPNTQSLNMVADDGSVQAVQIKDVVEADKAGWRLEGSEQRRSRELQEEYGDTAGQILSGIAGAGRGLTFGLSDWLMTEAGWVSPETLRNLEEANPAASLTGEGAAIAASMIASGGMSGTGILKTVTGGPRAAMRAGLKAENWMAHAVEPLAKGGLFGRMAAKAAAVGAGSSIEGALYSGGRFITESSLGNIDATVENLVDHVGMGALWGGGFGAGLGFAAKGAGELGKFTKEKAQSLVRMWERDTGNIAHKSLADKFYDLVAKGAKKVLPEGQAEHLDALSTAEKRAAAVRDVDDVLTDHSVQAAKLKNNILKYEDDVFDAWRELKPQEMDALAKEYTPSMNGNAYNDALAEFDGVLDGINTDLSKVLQADRGVYAGKAQVDGILNRMKKNAKRVEAAAAAGKNTDEIMSEMFVTMDATKRDFGKLAKKLGKMNVTPDVEATLDLVAGSFEKMRESLVKTKLWGQLAESQAGVNNAFHNWLKRKVYRTKSALVRAWEDSPDFRKANRIYKADPDGYKAIYRNAGNAENDLDMQHIAQDLVAEKELVKEFRSSMKWDRNPEKYAKQINAVKQITSSIDDFQKLNARVIDEVTLFNQLESLKRASISTGLAPGGIGAVGGFLLGGPAGAAAGAAAGSLISGILNPERAVRVLATIERATQRNKKSIELGISKYISSAAKGFGAKAKRSIAPVAVGSMERHYGVKDKFEAYKKARDELTKIASDPIGTAKRLEDSVESIYEAAPKLSQAIQQKGMQTASFLLSKMPQSPHRPSVFRKEWRPSAAALSRFERYFSAATNLKGVMKNLEDITPEAVETLMALYPETYKRIIYQITENMDKLQKLPYEKRIQLSTLFDVPLEPTLEPSFVAAMQAAQSRPDPRGINAPPRYISRASRGPDKNLSASQRLAQKG